MIRRPSGYILGPYNGFDDAQRRAVTPIQNDAFRRGILKRPTVCSICGFSDPANLEGRGYIFAHCENYAKPLDLHPACKRCHRLLHNRFRDPGGWARLLRSINRPGEWATLLSLDTASQWRSYNETYPDGLPPPSYQPSLPDLIAHMSEG